MTCTQRLRTLFNGNINNLTTKTMCTHTQTRKHTHTPTQQTTIDICNWTPFIWFSVWFDLVCSLFAVSLQIVRWRTHLMYFWIVSSKLSNFNLCLHPNTNPNRNLIQSISFANDKTFYTNLSKIDSLLWIRITKQWIAVSSDNKFNFLSFGHWFNGFTMVEYFVSSHHTINLWQNFCCILNASR